MSMRKLIFLITIAGMSTAVWLGAERTGFGVSLPVSQISITGNHRVSDEEILARIRFENGVDMFSLSLEEAARGLQHIPWIRDVSIHRVFPDQVRIQVEEYHPVARVELDSGVWGLVEEGGTIIPLSPEQVSTEVQGLWEIRFAGSSPSLEVLPQAVDLIKLIEAGSDFESQGGRIRFHPDEGFSLVLGQQDPLRIRIGWEDFSIKLKRLSQMRTYLRFDPRNLEKIDLDFPDRALVRGRPGSPGGGGGERG